MLLPSQALRRVYSSLSASRCYSRTAFWLGAKKRAYTQSIGKHPLDSAAAGDQDTSGSQSVSAEEVAKFAKISNEWWDPAGAFKYLHTMNTPRIQFIRSRLADLEKQAPSNSKGMAWMQGKRAVDVGCGGGLASESLARLGMNVLGIDAAAENIAMARVHMQRDPLFGDQQKRLRYKQMTAEQLVEKEEQFDVVVSLEVIEHVNDAATFCKSLVDLAKPGGLLVLSTMNRTALSYIIDVVVPEYLLGSVPRGTHAHEKFVAPHEMRQIFAALDAQHVDTQGLVLDPFNNQCHLVPADFGLLLPNAGVQANYISAFRKQNTPQII
ncbi:Hexaprenyldihydroxybenzoate methyltransferase, mitochondrial [Coemansia erecta]|nr:Hexaprenyldihydroxybenzoate methyltransferase, mitochondrial [Coemansia erecta]